MTDQSKLSRAERHAELVQKMAKKPGLRAKIDAMCALCCVDPYQAGTWRFQVENCPCFDCPLYSIRPTTYRSKQEDKE